MKTRDLTVELMAQDFGIGTLEQGCSDKEKDCKEPLADQRFHFLSRRSALSKRP
jgi:hypothetical protein